MRVLANPLPLHVQPRRLASPSTEISSSFAALHVPHPSSVVMSESAENPSPLPRRTRVACKACHARRVKCDAGDGQPCWHCRTRNTTCELIESRRGKYVDQTLNSCDVLKLIPGPDIHGRVVVKQKTVVFLAGSEKPESRPPMWSNLPLTLLSTHQTASPVQMVKTRHNPKMKTPTPVSHNPISLSNPKLKQMSDHIVLVIPTVYPTSLR